MTNRTAAWLDSSPCRCQESRARCAEWTLARRHFGADFGAQLVNQLQAVSGLDMPEGPTVAGLRTLRNRTDAVDRADLVAEHDGAVGAHQSDVPLLGIDQFRARPNHAALDQFGER